jgi:hypothetical protein
MNEPRVYKVTHYKDNVETVYLVSAMSERDAKSIVLDQLYERNFFRAESPERLANDPMGLLAAGQNGSWSNAKICKDHGCSVSAQLWTPEAPYKLYAFNHRTGAMS